MATPRIKGKTSLLQGHAPTHALAAYQRLGVDYVSRHIESTLTDTVRIHYYFHTLKKILVYATDVSLAVCFLAWLIFGQRKFRCVF
jgi:hypothetical protein